jgi:hypothetical protein
MAANEQLCQPIDVLSAWPGFANLPAYEQASLLNVASQRILDWTHRRFASTLLTELYDGHNTATLWLRTTPVITVVSVTIFFNNFDPTQGYQIDNSTGEGWTLYPNTGKLVRGPALGTERFNIWWPKGTQNIQIAYWAGLAAVPDPVIRATVFMVRYLHEQIKVSGIYAGESIGDYSYSLAAASARLGLPDHVVDLLQGYCHEDAIA